MTQKIPPSVRGDKLSILFGCEVELVINLALSCNYGEYTAAVVISLVVPVTSRNLNGDRLSCKLLEPTVLACAGGVKKDLGDFIAGSGDVEVGIVLCLNEKDIAFLKVAVE